MGLKKSIAKVALVLAVACGVVLATEGVVRGLRIAPALNRQYARMVADPHLPYRPPSKAVYVMGGPAEEFEHRVRTNGAGFRDDERTVTKPPGVFRILGIGDSFTFGVGADYEATYLAILEQRLNGRPGEHPRVEIVKAGVPRFYPETERILLEHYGLEYQPDLVVVGFTPNDVIDTEYGLDAVTTDASGFLKTREAVELGAVGQWLFLNSHIARIALADAVQRKVAERHPVRWQEIYRDNGFHEDDWLRVEAEYTRMRELAGEAGAEFVVFCIPHRGPWTDEAGYPAWRLARWAERNDALVVDGLPVFRAADRPARLFWKRDPHCTPDGYGLLGEALFEGLESADLVP